MSKHQYAFGRLESQRDRVRSIIVPRRFKGLLGALAGALLLVVFAAIAFALVDRAPPPPAKPVEKNAANERPAPRVIGASSRPKTDIRQTQAPAQPRPAESSPPAPAETRVASAGAPPPPLASSPPASSPVSERFPGPLEPVLRAGPKPVPAPNEDVTASVSERAERLSEPQPAEQPVRPALPQQQAARTITGEARSGASTDCLPAPLRAVLRDLEARFGPVTVVSTNHLTTDNHSPGSIRDKLHQACKAVDIRSARDPKEVVAFLKSRPEVGGINTYRNRLVHFDLNAGYKTERNEAAASGRPPRR
jgi:hypothetical protein